MPKKKKKALIIVIICVVLAAILCASCYWLMNSRNIQLFGKIVDRVQTDKKAVALTFDDGPTVKTGEILAVLDGLQVKCTFFLTGEGIEHNMDSAKAIARSGHQIGNHSYSHQRMIFKSSAFIEDEIDRTGALIRESGFGGEIVFRPPNFKKLLLLPLALQERNMVTVTCDVEPESYPEAASSPEKTVEHVLEKAQSGSIILLHVMYSSGKNSFDAIEGIVNGLKEKGYEFLTVNELLELS